MRAVICNLWFLLLCCMAGLRAEELKPLTELPAGIPSCKQDELKLNDCLKAAFQQMMPRVKTGIKELNIPAIDPYVVDKSSYQFNTGIVQGRASLKNVQVHGMGETVFDKVNLIIKDGRVRIELSTHIPSIFIEGAYKADMHINNIKLNPKGFFNVTLTDVRDNPVPEGELYQRDGHTFIRVTKYNSSPKIGEVRVHASGIFPDPTMNALILDFINQHWQQIYSTLLPETRSTWEPIVVKSINEFLSVLPIDLVLPDNFKL